jgi:ferredoxin
VLKTALARPAFNAFARRTSRFFATDDCNRCGLCARVCPIRAIELENGRPRWVKSGTVRMPRCINRCPTKAIQYGAGTKKRGGIFLESRIDRDRDEFTPGLK